VIVVVSFPVLPGLFQSARALRLLRLMRFLRLAAFGARAIQAARATFSPEGFRYAALLALLLVAVGGSSLAFVESDTVPSLEDGIWWALVTVTTVGYGDIAPHTLAGRAIAAVVMLFGISFFAFLTATIAATFMKQEEQPEEIRSELREISARLDRIERALER
jgi:voltage-gated potassium channel